MTSMAWSRPPKVAMRSSILSVLREDTCQLAFDVNTRGNYNMMAAARRAWDRARHQHRSALPAGG